MKKILMALFYFIFFVYSLLVFLPKENMFFYGLNSLKKEKIQVVNNSFKDTYFGFDISKIDLFYNNIKVSDISNIDFKTFIFKTNLNIDQINVDKSLTKFIPHGIEYLNISHDLLNPTKILISSKFTLGSCLGYVDLVKRTVTLNLEVSKSFNSRYPMLVKKLKKIKEGEYTYEYKYQ